MQIGVVYPQTELGGNPEAIRQIGRTVEDLSFDHLLAYDHVLGAVHERRKPALAGPYTEQHPFHDPFVMFSHLAAVTNRISFVTGVLVLPQRQTALVARQAADVELLSGGRLRLGVGVGWNYVEYEALGQSFHRRGARQEEQIGLLRRLWYDEEVTFAGSFESVDRVALVPKPSQRIPIWIGGYSDLTFDRAARIGDGFIFGSRTPDVVECWNKLRARVSMLGRPVKEFGGEYVVSGRRGVHATVEMIERWHGAGGTHASVNTMGLGFSSVEEHTDYLNSVAEALGRV